jgi:hypothetical protein
MNAPLSIRAKLIIATLSVLVVFGFGLFVRDGAYSTGEIFFRIACFIFGVVLAIGGIFRNAQFQIFWGYGLAFAAVVLIAAFCIGDIHGSSVLWAAVCIATAPIGAYLLILDADVKIYRENIKRKCGT